MKLDKVSIGYRVLYAVASAADLPKRGIRQGDGCGSEISVRADDRSAKGRHGMAAPAKM